MARASQALIAAIRRAAVKIENGTAYQWGHMGACNCGHLAQELTNLSKAQIHEYALRGQGDWTDQVAAFCPTGNMPMDLLISELIGAGLSLEDLINLERLKDPAVLKRIPPERRPTLRHNAKPDVALYLYTWADLLQEQLLARTSTPREVEVVVI